MKCRMQSVELYDNRITRRTSTWGVGDAAPPYKNIVRMAYGMIPNLSEYANK